MRGMRCGREKSFERKKRERRHRDGDLRDKERRGGDGGESRRDSEL